MSAHCPTTSEMGFPVFSRYIYISDNLGGDATSLNLSRTLRTLITDGGFAPETIFLHIIAILHSPAYRLENAGALRMDWPRVPVPRDTNALCASANLGRGLATLLDPDTSASGVSTGVLRAGLKTLGLPTKRGGGSLALSELSLAAGWGSTQAAGAGNTIVMPGRGSTANRDYTANEREALAREGEALGLTINQVLKLLGDKTLDIYLNAEACWANVPTHVWSYTLGGYQVIKKWLSYREESVLGRALQPGEVAYLSEMIRRIGAILLMGPALDASYRVAAGNAMIYEELNVSRDAQRERKDAKATKRGSSRRLTPAMRPPRLPSKSGRD
jgi:hypothetical protein